MFYPLAVEAVEEVLPLVVPVPLERVVLVVAVVAVELPLAEFEPLVPLVVAVVVAELPLVVQLELSEQVEPVVAVEVVESLLELQPHQMP